MSTPLETIADRVRARRQGYHSFSLYEPPLMDLPPSGFKKGMVFYCHHNMKNFKFTLLRKLVCLGQTDEDEQIIRFDRIPIGSNQGVQIRRYWKGVNETHMTLPSEEYQVLDGLRVPDELKYEVYLYLAWNRL